MAGIIYESSNSDNFNEYENIKVLKTNSALRELQTILRDKLAYFVKKFKEHNPKLVVEEGLNYLPYSSLSVITPTGVTYHGLQYQKGTCGVSIMRSGEAMEKGLRDCCQSMRIGKILIQNNTNHNISEGNESKVLFASFPDDISERTILLMYPIISTGHKMIQAIRTLKENHVSENNIIVLNLFATPNSIINLATMFPRVTFITSEIHNHTPTHFGSKYYGTD